VEEKWRREEEEQNVTQKAGNYAAASFYGNLNHNMAMGGE
jgi:hypothetical protein